MYCNQCIYLDCYTDTEKVVILDGEKSILHFRCNKGSPRYIPRDTRSELIRSPAWCLGRVKFGERECEE